MRIRFIAVLAFVPFVVVAAACANGASSDATSGDDGGGPVHEAGGADASGAVPDGGYKGIGWGDAAADAYVAPETGGQDVDVAPDAGAPTDAAGDGFDGYVPYDAGGPAAGRRCRR